MLCYLYKLHYVDAMKVAFNHFFALQYYFELKFSCKKCFSKKLNAIIKIIECNTNKNL